MQILFIPVIALLLALTGCDSRETSPSEGTAEPTAQAPEEHAESAHDDAEHKGEEGEMGRAAIDPQTAQAVGIRIGEAAPAALRENLTLYGVIRPNLERVRNVSARFPGVVRSMRKSVGDPVKQGEVIATVEGNESLETYSVPSPISGVITARNYNVGETAESEPLYTVTDLSSVWAEISLFPRDLAKVRTGQQATVRSVDGALEGRVRIAYLSPLGTGSSQSVLARAVLENPEGRWRPGLYITANVVLGEQPVPVAIDAEAIQQLDGESVVFVPAQADGFEPRAVRIGRSDGHRAEVLAGLEAGEAYVVANSFLVKAEIEKASVEHED